MKISQSQVGIKTHHEHQHLVAEKTSVEIESRDQFQARTASARAPTRGLENLSRAGRLRQLSGSSSQIKKDAERAKGVDDSEFVITGDQETDAQLLALAIMVARLTGRPVYVGRIDPSLNQTSAEGDELLEKRASTASQGEPEPPRIRFEHERIEREVEHLSATALGQVITADGREISFELSLDMERFAQSRERLSVTTGELKDPLILDLGPMAARFTEDKIRFDIDADGALDDMPLLDRNGGFLVMDHNQNGVIDDGAEVIGALSGDGFADLQGFDQDGNMWIDEGDEVFDRLGVWMPSAEGERRLLGLLEVGIGALYLGAVSAEFRHTGEDKQTLAQQRALSVYLREDGSGGSMRRVDVSV